MHFTQKYFVSNMHPQWYSFEARAIPLPKYTFRATGMYLAMDEIDKYYISLFIYHTISDLPRQLYLRHAAHKIALAVSCLMPLYLMFMYQHLHSHFMHKAYLKFLSTPCYHRFEFGLAVCHMCNAFPKTLISQIESIES